MAEEESFHSQGKDTEPVVNRWIVDYYVFQALQSFERSQYEEFCSIKVLLEQLLSRPVENTDTIPIKIQVLRFLSRIQECEKLDAVLGPLTPLESALLVLEDMSHVCHISKRDFKKVSTSIKEMIVGLYIKSNKFDKAKKMLEKHFPKPVLGKKAIFMGLIQQKHGNHEIIQQIDFQKFKGEMVAFCQRLCCCSVPFLFKAAKQLIDQRVAEQHNRSPRPDDQAQLSPSCGPQPSTNCHHSVIQWARLEAAYTALAVGTSQETFAELENEVEMEQQDEEFCLQLSPESERRNKVDSEWDGLFQRDSGSPMEASPADQTEQTHAAPETQAGSKTPPVLQSRKPYSVARLVVEPDSQPSSQPTAAPQETRTEVRSEKPTWPLRASREKTLQCTEKDCETTTTKNSLQSNSTMGNGASTSRATKSPDREDSLDSEANGEALSRSSDSLTELVEKSSPDNDTGQQEVGSSCESPHRERSTGNPPSRDMSTTDDLSASDTSDGSPSRPSSSVPRRSSTPQKGTSGNQKLSHSKWKELYKNAKESKETWSEDESYFSSKNKRQNNSTISDLGNKKKKMWTAAETQKLREGVKKFGEGNWSQIKSYYSFKDRTNINLKDRWRILVKNNAV